jgi:predicted enzyme related to lactoylglutathione lyase
MNNPFSQHGAFSWCELMTSDPEGAKTFYGKLFDWTLESAANAPAGVDYTMIKCADQPIGGVMAIPQNTAGMPPHWGTYITVDDVDVTLERALDMGAKVCCPPQDITGVGRFCVLQDPQGAVFSIIAYVGCRE